MKINSLIIGKGKGSAGNVTVVQLKGQTILKQKASIVANPRSVLQVKQRNFINRAVVAYQLIGNIVKSGWTSLLPFCSQYNTYVSANHVFFRDATFSKASMVNNDLLGSQATKGRLGTLQFTVGESLDEEVELLFNTAQLQSIAKIGDKVKVLGGGAIGSNMGFAEKEITEDLLSGVTTALSFAMGENWRASNNVAAIWLETADGKDSTSSEFATI